MGSCDSIPQQSSSEKIEEARLEEYCCEILGINRSATEKEIRKAYKKLALKYHPDKTNRSQEKFIEINQAYKILIALREAGAHTQRDLVVGSPTRSTRETLHLPQKE